jgi:quercetin dioxygenase-like cupin family protein
MSGVPYATLPQMQDWAAGVMARPRDYTIGDDYMHRWWVIPRNESANVYLHHILKSDDDRAMHDHPWPNTSLLLFGSYIEHTPEGTFVRKAGDVIYRPAEALHRLEVIPGERAISLFMTGPKVREWGFACEHGWVHWQDFTNEHDSSRTGRGCGEHGDLSPTTIPGEHRA